MKLGQTILDIRKERKMTQEEFAQIFHVTRQTVSNWEKEKNYPDLETLISMSDEFNICLLYTSPSPRDVEESRMPSSA